MVSPESRHGLYSCIQWIVTKSPCRKYYEVLISIAVDLEQKNDHIMNPMNIIQQKKKISSFKKKTGRGT